jgi:imidazolonepropionase-like amidohydrolase
VRPYVRFVFIASLFLLGVAAPVSAQSYAITGAKIYTLAGKPIENGTVVIRDGKIAAVGANVPAPSGARVINARGLHVYPGMFDSVTQLGLTEVGQGAAGTVDTTELGDFSPQIVAATAVHPSSELIPVARANGITHALAAPGIGGGFGGGPVIGGQACVISLDGWVTEEMLVRRSAALVLNWPVIRTGGGGGFGGGFGAAARRPFTEARQEYERRVSEIADWMVRARHYAQAAEKGNRNGFERDLKLEALAPFAKGELPILVVANESRSIQAAVEFAEQQKLRIIIAGGRDAWKVKELLKQKKIPVILGKSQALPPEDDDPYDRQLTKAGELYAAGVEIAVASFDDSDSRTLPYEAANYVPYGLPWEEALKAITINPARFFGLDKQFGTIEPGKVANLIVTSGDPLEIRTEIRYVFIHGRQSSLENKHKRLYDQYRARPQ